MNEDDKLKDAHSFQADYCITLKLLCRLVWHTVTSCFDVREHVWW